MLAALLLCALPQIADATPHDPNRLNELERLAGWRLLWDGTNRSGPDSKKDDVDIHDGWVRLLDVREELGEIQANGWWDCEFDWRIGDKLGTTTFVWRENQEAHGTPFGRNSFVAGSPATGGVMEARTLRARFWHELPDRTVALFDGKTLAGWRVLGDALYSVDDGGILGRIGGGKQSFLVTERSFGDFVLDVEVKTELPGNSGIQVRSHVRDDGRVFGYQLEIDPSERAWSGGLYDEARRGWLQDLKTNDAGRAAFKRGDWNHYRIECVGPWIRAWVNGVPTADCFDPLDLEGVLGLQVHAGDDTRVRWRNFRMVDLGRHRWSAPTPRPQDTAIALDLGSGKAQAAEVVRLKEAIEDCGARLVLRKPSAPLRLELRAGDDAPATPAAGLALGGGLFRSGDAWYVELADPALWGDVQDGAEHELAVLVYGGRISLFLDGAPRVRVNEIDGARRGALRLVSAPNSAALEAVKSWSFLEAAAQ